MKMKRIYQKPRMRKIKMAGAQHMLAASGGASDTTSGVGATRQSYGTANGGGSNGVALWY